MDRPGRVIAQGRDTEILEAGPGLVLRRPRVPRSLAGEAEVMTWVREQGYPCPAVDSVTDEGMVMERIEGVSMLDDLGRHPWTLRARATLLADLHGWLHRLVVPAELAGRLDQPFGPAPADQADQAGQPDQPDQPDPPNPPNPPEPDQAALLHLDLHPGNVMLTADGPVVIDWSNAAAGPGPADVAEAWLLLAAGEVPGSAVDRAVAAVGRTLLVRAFLAAADRRAAARYLPAVLERRRGDPHMAPAELAAMARLVDRQARRRRARILPRD